MNICALLLFPDMLASLNCTITGLSSVVGMYYIFQTKTCCPSYFLKRDFRYRLFVQNVVQAHIMSLDKILLALNSVIYSVCEMENFSSFEYCTPHRITTVLWIFFPDFDCRSCADGVTEGHQAF